MGVALCDTKTSKNQPELDVNVSEVRDPQMKTDLAPLALLIEEAIVFLAESNWKEQPVHSVA